jgi:hypothetical protein
MTTQRIVGGTITPVLDTAPDIPTCIVGAIKL